MLGKEIYDLVYKTLTKSLGYKDIDVIIEHMPTSLDKVFAMPGYGFTSLTNKGAEIIASIKQVYSLFAINDFSVEEVYSLYKDYIKNIKGMPSIYEESFGEFATAFNAKTATFGVSFSLSAKKLIVFCEQKGIIFYENDVRKTKPSISELGKRNGFIIKTKYMQDGSEYSVVKLTKQSCEYLMTALVDIFYMFYGFNKLNYYKLNSNEDYNFLEDTKRVKKQILIFDLDATIFDTDFLRKKRKKDIWSILPNEYDQVKFVEGFEEVFLDPQSELFLKNNLLLFITGSPLHYANKLFKKLLVKYEDLNYELHCSCGHNKIEVINDFLNRNHASMLDVIAFGDDEKDALIYSIVGVPYYIVNNYYGYGLQDEIFINLVYPNETQFRNVFMYTIVPVNKGSYTKDFLSDYIDDIVVYFRRYYDKTDTKGRCPKFKGRPQLPRLTFQQFGDNKRKYVSSHYLDFIDYDFDDFYVTKEVVFAKVPGHDELRSDSKSPCRYIIDELSRIYGPEKNYHGLLLRSTPLKEHHGSASSNRHIRNHMRSIYVNPSYKLKGKIVYLFDDVLTTGASMMACVELLYRSGAGHVVCFCLGKTCPRKKFPLKMIDGGEVY